MKTDRLLQSGLLNNGEPRHYASWNLPEVPKLHIAGDGIVGEALYRRQKAHAPKIRKGMAGWMQIWHSLRKG